MTGKEFHPVFTSNFTENLDRLEQYLATQEATAAFTKIVQRLVQDVIPTLCQFPRSGRTFLERSIGSMETAQWLETLASLLCKGDDIREFIFDDYLILYLVRDGRVFFLAIKHHRQLSFDLKKFWVE